MVSKNEVQYQPLVLKNARIITKIAEFRGKILLETQQSFKILASEKEDPKEKTILKSSIEKFFLIDQIIGEVEISPELLKGTLISRLKKFK